MRRFYFYGLNFLLGFVSLAVEIIIARAIAPYWGAGTFIWGFVVGFVLLVLALGYWYGGKLADRYPDEKHLIFFLAPSALFLVGLSFVTPVDQRLLLFSAIASIALFLMGAGAPWVLRILMRDVAHSGQLAGRLFAFSTIGSFLGSILAVVLLLPFLGTRISFLVLALVLLFYLALRSVFLFLPFFILSTAFFFVGAKDEGVIWQKESRDQLVRVFEDEEGKRLVLNDDINTQSIYRKGEYLTNAYWDTPLYLWPASGQKKITDVLILGNGAGTSARSLHHFYPDLKIDVVEVDPVVNQAAREFFDFREDQRLRLVEKDARTFIRQNQKKYDMIFLDVYDSSFIPFQFATEEFYQEMRNDLNPEGVLLVNVNSSGVDSVLPRLSATGLASFSNVFLYQIRGNDILLFTRGRVKNTFPSPLPNAKKGVIELKEIAPSGKTWTDDKSDIEILFPF